MTEELEFLKHSGAAAAAAQAQQTPAEKNWKNRRSQKLEKMELLNLQSNLQSEIHAKQAINEELSVVRSELESARKYARRAHIMCTGAVFYTINSLSLRDVSDFKSRVDSYSREILRKEAQIRDLQARLENGEGSKCSVHLFPLDSSILPM